MDSTKKEIELVIMVIFQRHAFFRNEKINERGLILLRSLQNDYGPVKAAWGAYWAHTTV